MEERYEFKLPEYEPSDLVWKNIVAKLDSKEQKNSWEGLPQYEPNEKVWEGISSVLNRRHRFTFVKWVAAASVLIVGAMFFTLNSKQIKYSELEVPSELMLTDNDNSNYGYSEIKKICLADKIACKKPEFRVLELELEELNKATIRLKRAIGQYNAEPELIEQLIDIENQKASVISKMASQI